MSDAKRVAGRIGGLTSWANTVDRTARTAKARANGPSSIEWHLERLDAERFANATDAQRLAAAESARKLYFARIGAKSSRARRRGSAAA